MEIEILQIHIRGVGDCEAVGHFTARQYFFDSGLRQCNSQLSRLIISRQLNDLSRVFERYIKGFSRHLIVRWRRYLSDEITA